jgi:hypothetical protein
MLASSILHDLVRVARKVPTNKPAIHSMPFYAKRSVQYPTACYRTPCSCRWNNEARYVIGCSDKFLQRLLFSLIGKSIDFVPVYSDFRANQPGKGASSPSSSTIPKLLREQPVFFGASFHKVGLREYSIDT